MPRHHHDHAALFATSSNGARLRCRVNPLAWLVSAVLLSGLSGVALGNDVAIPADVLDDKQVDAQVAPAATPTSGEPATLDTVVATGTRFNNRTVLESPVPIDVLSQEDLRSGGYSDTPSALAALVPSVNFPPTNTSSSNAFQRRLTMRGLNASQVLVLVNGKRRHFGVNASNAAVDFNALPPTAISRIEVLRDGAAAQYGSDAIAGVVNVILRKDLGTEVSTTVGQTYKGDGSTVETNLDHGFEIGDGGFLHTSLYYRHRDTTNRQGYDKRQMYFGQRNGQPIIFPTVSATDHTPVLLPGDMLDPREATIDRKRTYRIGDPKSEEAGVFFNAELPVGDFDLYAFGGGSRREVETPFVFRTPKDNNNVREIHPDGFQPSMLGIVSDASLFVGIKGMLGEWNLDASQGWGTNNTRPYPKNTVNASMGTASPTEFYAGKYAVQQAVTNFDLSRAVDLGWQSPLYLAMGAEYRWDAFKTEAGSLASYQHGGVPILDGPNAGGVAAGGSQGFGGIRPEDVVDVDRSNYALYVDAEALFFDRLTVSGAARFERYSDFGNTLDGKLSFRYEINPQFALRGSASTGFRAPTLVDSYYTSTESNFFDGQSFVTRRFPPTSAVGRLMGAADLSPEESVSVSFGATFQLGDRFDFTADLYQVDVKDQLTASSIFNDAKARAFFAANGFPNVQGASFMTNALDSRVRGLDLTGRYNVEFDHGGKLTLTTAINLNNRKITRVTDSPDALKEITDIPLINRAPLLSYANSLPRRNINLSANYSLGDWSLFARTMRHGQYAIASANPIFDQAYGAKWITDVSATRRIGERYEVTIGANNVFDTYPDEVSAANNPWGSIKYSPSSPFGFNGGYYYLRLKARF
ncbi:TonB-dependent receptor plug domain-containing protein [Luteimonas sp. RIT-PG2_3]